MRSREWNPSRHWHHPEAEGEAAHDHAAPALSGPEREPAGAGQQGRSSVSALQRSAGNAAVVQMLRSKPESGARVVGGDDSHVTFVESGTGRADDVIAPGEGGWARHALPDIATGGQGRAGLYDAARLTQIEPDFSGVDKRISWEAAQYAQQEDNASGFFTSKPWAARYRATAKDLQAHMELLERQRSDQRGMFAAFNSWAPRANDMFGSMARLEALEEMLGVSDPEAMVAAVQQQLTKAREIGVRAQNRAAGGHGGASLDVPALDASVQSAQADASQAAKEMRASWLGLEQNALAMRAEQTSREGDADQKQLDQIEEIKAFVRELGKTVDTSLSLMSGATALQAASTGAEALKAGKDIAKTAGVPMSVEGAAGAVVDFVYYDEVRKLKNRLTQVKSRCAAVSGASAALEVQRKADEFAARMDAFALKCVQLQQRVDARQLAYVQLGEQLDAAARTDPDLVKSGQAVPKGKERFATVMLVTSQVRELLALARGARSSFETPDEIRNWALGLDAERKMPRNFGQLVRNDSALTRPEIDAIENLYGQVGTFHLRVTGLQELLGPVDAAGAELIKALSGGKGGQY